jgi:hypothetical protein
MGIAKNYKKIEIWTTVIESWEVPSSRSNLIYRVRVTKNGVPGRVRAMSFFSFQWTIDEEIRIATDASWAEQLQKISEGI